MLAHVELRHFFTYNGLLAAHEFFNIFVDQSLGGSSDEEYTSVFGGVPRLVSWLSAECDEIFSRQDFPAKIYYTVESMGDNIIEKWEATFLSADNYLEPLQLAQASHTHYHIYVVTLGKIIQHIQHVFAINDTVEVDNKNFNTLTDYTNKILQNTKNILSGLEEHYVLSLDSVSSILVNQWRGLVDNSILYCETYL